MTHFDADDNTRTALWIRGGKGNQVNDFDIEDNTGTGVYRLPRHEWRGTKCSEVKS